MAHTRGTLPLDHDRDLALGLVRATEAAAIASARFVGHGDKNQVDQAAVDAMRPVLGSVGNGSDPDVDIAVDPVDGTIAAAKGLPDAVAVVGLSERGTMVDPSAPTSDILASVARALGKAVEELTVAVLDRPRHAQTVAEIRAAGAAVKFLLDGDLPGRSPWDSPARALTS